MKRTTHIIDTFHLGSESTDPRAHALFWVRVILKRCVLVVISVAKGIERELCVSVLTEVAHGLYAEKE